jgi:hypothetical protein
VDLRITPDNGSIDLHGQVLGEGFTGGRAVLKSNHLEKEAVVGSTGEFRFDRVPKGFYTLTLGSSEREIVIEDVEL